MTVIAGAPSVMMPPEEVWNWKTSSLQVRPPLAEEIEKLYQKLVPFDDSLAGCIASAVPSGVLPGPLVRPEIRMYSTAARTTVIATSRIVAMIGDTPRLVFCRQRRLGRVIPNIRVVFPSLFRPALRDGHVDRSRERTAAQHDQD